MHFGLIPRSQPRDLRDQRAARPRPAIQVGLFNVLEERDVQIRGYPIRLDLDVCLVFCANPEDYTNRGRIVTPLKDRIGSVVRTHYPETRRRGHRRSPSRTPGSTAPTADGSAAASTSTCRAFMEEIVEEVVRLARTSPHVSQASGVSVRTWIANLETVVSNAERRASSPARSASSRASAT